MFPRVFVTWTACAALATGGDFSVEVRNLRNDQGMVRALLFAKEEGFPDQQASAVARAEVKAAKGTLTLVFKNVRPGRHAVSVLHDENGDGKAGVNFIGIPTEGVGVSGRMGNTKPAFANCVMDVAAGGAVTVTMKYW